MSTNNTSILNTVIAVAGLVGIGYAIATHNKLAKISERLDRSIDSLADDMEIDISDELINKAVDKAVAAAAKNAVNIATTNAMAEVKRDIHNKVSAAVEREYGSIKDKVLSEATVSASKINVDRVRREVEAAAKKAALDKFDVNLESVLEKFNGDLDNTVKIYSAIKNVMAPATVVPASTSAAPRECVIRVG